MTSVERKLTDFLGFCKSTSSDVKSDEKNKNWSPKELPTKKIKLCRETLLNEITKSKLNEKHETNLVNDLFHVNSFLNWRLIQAENLNLKYTKLFQNSSANKAFRRLEDEVEYFTGDLLKVKIFGKWHSIPRKQVSYGNSGLSYTFSGNCIPAKPWIPLILELKKAVEEAVNFGFNFVLVNRYKDGTDYMGEHRDDEKDLDPNAPIASLSFGQSRDFVFRHKDSRGCNATRKIQPMKIELEHGSLLCMLKPTNSYWYHSLPVRKRAHGVRVNLTFRKML